MVSFFDKMISGYSWPLYMDFLETTCHDMSLMSGKIQDYSFVSLDIKLQI